MLLLKATKTSLYQLVAAYEALPGMRKTEFSKTPRARSYWLKWTKDGAICEVYFSVGWGYVLLAIEKRDFEGNRTDRQVHRLEISDLKKRGFFEEREGTP